MCGQSQAERAGEKWRGGGQLLLNTRLLQKRGEEGEADR